MKKLLLATAALTFGLATAASAERHFETDRSLCESRSDESLYVGDGYFTVHEVTFTRTSPIRDAGFGAYKVADYRVTAEGEDLGTVEVHFRHATDWSLVQFNWSGSDGFDAGAIEAVSCN